MENYFGNTLRRLRVSSGLSQKALADVFNVAQNTISQYEKGDRKPDIDFLKKVSEYFNVSVDYLLDNISRNADDSSAYSVPTEFTDPIEARKYVMMHAIFGSDGLNVAKMDDEEIIKFANDLMKQMEMVSYKYRK